MWNTEREHINFAIKVVKIHDVIDFSRLNATLSMYYLFSVKRINEKNMSIYHLCLTVLSSVPVLLIRLSVRVLDILSDQKAALWNFWYSRTFWGPYSYTFASNKCYKTNKTNVKVMSFDSNRALRFEFDIGKMLQIIYIMKGVWLKL